METLEIKKEHAVAAHANAKNSGKKLLEDLLGKKVFIKKVKDRIKTVADVLEDNGFTQESFDESCKGLTVDEKAYRLSKLIGKSLNEGWEPNWDNSNETKYFPWFKLSSSGFRFSDCGGWDAGSAVGSRLCFKSRELAIYAGETFTDVYKDFMIIK